MTEGNPIGLLVSETVRVQVRASDPDSDPLDVEWRVIPESTEASMGGDFERGIEQLDVEISARGVLDASIVMPETPGAYRIFVTVRDGQGHAGTANLPVYVVESASADSPD